MTVQFTDHYACFNGEVFAKIVTDQFRATAFVQDTNVCIGHLSEVLTSCVSFMDRDTESDFFCFSRDISQIHTNLLIVPVTYTSTIVAVMNNGAIRIFTVVIENEIGFGIHFARSVYTENG